MTTNNGFDPFSEESIRKLADAMGATPEEFDLAFGQIKACEGAINKARILIESKDPVILNQLREIIAYSCDMIEYIDEDFSPSLLRAILGFAGSIAVAHTDKWAEYTKEESPKINRNVAIALYPSGREDA